jgi:hypothetical protein
MRASVWVSRLRTTIFCKSVSVPFLPSSIGDLLLYFLLPEDRPAIERLDTSWSSHLCHQGGHGAPDFGIIDLIAAARRRHDRADAASS